MWVGFWPRPGLWPWDCLRRTPDAHHQGAAGVFSLLPSSSGCHSAARAGVSSIPGGCKVFSFCEQLVPSLEPFMAADIMDNRYNPSNMVPAFLLVIIRFYSLILIFSNYFRT